MAKQATASINNVSLYPGLTLIESLKRLQGQPTLVAFNRSIADELKKRVPAGCDAMTRGALTREPVGTVASAEGWEEAARAEGWVAEPAWSARCDCYNGHGSASGRCRTRSCGGKGQGVTDPTRVKGEAAICAECRAHCC